MPFVARPDLLRICPYLLTGISNEIPVPSIANSLGLSRKASSDAKYKSHPELPLLAFVGGFPFELVMCIFISMF
jgi:hypothetical protein